MKWVEESTGCLQVHWDEEAGDKGMLNTPLLFVDLIMQRAGGFALGHYDPLLTCRKQWQ